MRLKKRKDKVFKSLLTGHYLTEMITVFAQGCLDSCEGSEWFFFFV